MMSETTNEDRMYPIEMTLQGARCCISIGKGVSIDFGIDKNEMKRLVIALAELDLTIDEWLCFKMKELILADRLSKENRGEE